MKNYRFYVTTNHFEGRDIEVETLEELFDALKVAKNEWEEDHIHLEMCKIQKNTGNSIKMYEVVIPIDEEAKIYTVVNLD